MMKAMPQIIETAMNVAAAKSQISLLTCSMGSLSCPHGWFRRPRYMPDAHIAPAVARSVTPVMNIAISNRVSQLLRMAAPQLLDCVGPGVGTKRYGEGSFWATSR